MKNKEIIASIGNEILSCGNKVGKLIRNNDNYVNVYLSAWNVPNRKNWVYDATEQLKAIHSPGSRLHYLASTGRLRGEIDHPKMESGMSWQSYIERLRRIENKWVSFHIKDLELDLVKDEFKNSILVSKARVTGSGAHQAQFDKRLANPDENLDFSMRAICHPSETINGVLHRRVKYIATWDEVNAGGHPIANKYDSPCFEDDQSGVEEPLDDFIDIDEITLLAAENNMVDSSILGLEGDDYLFDLRMIRDEKGQWRKLQVANYHSTLGWSPLKY